jgi:hypothetical protein
MERICELLADLQLCQLFVKMILHLQSRWPQKLQAFRDPVFFTVME